MHVDQEVLKVRRHRCPYTSFFAWKEQDLQISSTSRHTNASACSYTSMLEKLFGTLDRFCFVFNLNTGLELEIC